MTTSASNATTTNTTRSSPVQKQEHNVVKQHEHMQHEHNHSSTTVQVNNSKVRGRWDILRSALRGTSTLSTQAKQASIHSFQGWKNRFFSRQPCTLPTSAISLTTTEHNVNHNQQSDRLLNVVNRIYDCHQLESIILGLQAAQPIHQQQRSGESASSTGIPTNLFLRYQHASSSSHDNGLSSLKNIRVRLAKCGISCRPISAPQQQQQQQQPESSTAMEEPQVLHVKYPPILTDRDALYRCYKYTPIQYKHDTNKNQSQSDDDELSIIIRERLAPHVHAKNLRVRLQELTTRYYNDDDSVAAGKTSRSTVLDNTGQACIWDSAFVLAHLLIRHILQPLVKQPSCKTQQYSSSTFLSNVVDWIHQQSSQRVNNRTIDATTTTTTTSCIRVVELGAGMAGLAGLIWAKFIAQHNNIKNNDPIMSTRVVLTDGHAQAVQSNEIQILLNYPSLVLSNNGKRDENNNNNVDISCRQLQWTRQLTFSCNDGDDDVDDNTLFHLAFVSDCLHFQYSHVELLATLANLLCVGGMALLCQPPRSDALDNFVQLAEGKDHDENTDPLWCVEWHKELPILDQHFDNDNDKHHFDPNIHLPQLLILTKRRPMTREDLDYLAQAHTKLHDGNDNDNN